MDLSRACLRFAPEMPARWSPGNLLYLRGLGFKIAVFIYPNKKPAASDAAG